MNETSDKLKWMKQGGKNGREVIPNTLHLEGRNFMETLISVSVWPLCFYFWRMYLPPIAWDGGGAGGRRDRIAG